jgi:hypothetical protein
MKTIQCENLKPAIKGILLQLPKPSQDQLKGVGNFYYSVNTTLVLYFSNNKNLSEFKFKILKPPMSFKIINV